MKGNLRLISDELGKIYIIENFYEYSFAMNSRNLGFQKEKVFFVMQ